MNTMRTPDWKAARALFPSLKKYTFLNAAGGAPLARPVAAAGARYYEEALAHGDAYWEHWLERMEQARADLARFIGAAPEEVGFTINTSHGMSLVAGALKGRGTVLTMRDEFPSSTLAWLNAGYKVRFVEPVNGEYPPERIEKAITPGVKILVTSYVEYRTGFRQDLAAVGRLCRRRGLTYVVNATQALGAMPVDVKKAGIDFMVFSCFKWTMAGYGAAGIFAAKKHLGAVKFQQAGWRSVPVPEEMDNEAVKMKKAASAVEAGCMHFPSIFALGASIKLLSGLGAANIQARILDLGDYLVSELGAIGAATATPLRRACRSGITIIKCRNAAKAVEKLAAKGIMVSARGAGIRVAIHFYNDRNDIDKLIAALKKLGPGYLN
jgi:selenocysteine lyase/cysteine desulfurase